MSLAMRSALKTYCFALIVLTVAGWAIRYPLFNPRSRFSDFTDYYYKILHLSRGGDALIAGLPMFVYPAPAVFVYSIFIRLFSAPLAAYLAFSGTAVIIGAWVLIKTVGLRNRTAAASILLTFACSYPLLFCLDRGNIEIVVALFWIAGLFCFLRQSYWASAALFGLAMCVKPFPGLFFLLFLQRKLFKQIALAGTVWIVVNLAALAWIGPNLRSAYLALKGGYAAFVYEYVAQYRPSEIQFDHSAFSCFKQFVRTWQTPEDMQHILAISTSLYWPIAICFLVSCAWLFRNKPLVNQIFAIILLMTWTPPVSGDYTLIALLPLWGILLIQMCRQDVPRPLLFLLPLAVLMTPQSYLRIAGIGFSGQFKSLLIAGLLVAVHRVELPQYGTVRKCEFRSVLSIA